MSQRVRYQPGDVIDGRFRIQRLLGTGMSEVYAVVDDAFDQVRALKALPEDTRDDPNHHERLIREAEATRRIRHPNVVHVCEIRPDGAASPYFVMELLTGETLGQYLKRVGPMPPTLALDLMREAAAGLAAAHAEGIYHRDVKPDNLFVCMTGERISGLKVIDFGLSQAGAELMPQNSQVMGTAEYMAPEQVVADPADARSDIYSLGVVLFRLVTEELPFDTDLASDVLAHHLASNPPPPSWLVDQLDVSIDTIVLTAVRKHPDNRYPTMKALLEDIDRVTNGQPARGVEPKRLPDHYEPRSELGKSALRLLTRRHNSSQPAPAPLDLSPSE
jgi:eukaryotic-like serine/threonine-protein kinase